VKKALCVALLLWLTSPAPFKAQVRSCNSPTGENPKLIWTPEQQCVWDRMRQENHPWAQTIITNGEQDGSESARYASLGRWAALAYQITGNKKYVQKSLAQLKGDSAGFVRLLEGNGLREWGIEYNLIYDWISPGLSGDDREQFAAYLRRVADSILAAGVRFNDSDQMIGTYFFFALTDINLGTNYLSRPIVDADRGLIRSVGGYAATAADLTSMRNALRKFVAIMGEGGTFIEGAEYNSGTLELLYMGADAVRTATGVDHFPEVAQFRSQHAVELRHEFVPGLKDSFQHGDIENPNALLWHHLDDLMAWVANKEPDAGIRQLHRDLKQVHNQPPEPGATWPLYPRFFYANSPYEAGIDWKAGTSRHHVSPGMGHVFARTGWGDNDRALHVWFQNMENGTVDHFHGVLGDFRFYRKGRWAFTHPLAYASPDVKLPNQIVVANNGAGFEAGGLTRNAFEDGTFAYASGTNTGLGPTHAEGWYGTPQTYLHENTRNVFWLMDGEADVVVLYDRVHADDPKVDEPQWDLRYENQKQSIRESPGLKNHVLHTAVRPRIEGPIVSWEDNGMNLRIRYLAPDDLDLRVIKDTTIYAIPKTTRLWDTFLTVLTAADGADNVTASRLAGAAGEAVEGAIIQRVGVPDVTLLFSAKRGSKVKTTISEGRVMFDPRKLDQVVSARLFKNGFDVTVPPGTVYIADLDNGRSWTVKVGSAPVPFERRDDIVVAHVNVAGTLSVRAENTVFEPNPVPAPESEPETTPPPDGVGRGPAPPQETRKNLASEMNGGRATASSTYSVGYPASSVINGDRNGLSWENGGGWNDATPDAFPDWVQVDFAAAQKIAEVDIFTVQDRYAAPVTPTLDMPFTLYGLKNFQVQFRRGTEWVTVPNGAISNNGLVWRRITFDPVTTTAIRIFITATTDPWSRVVEVEAYEVAATNPTARPSPSLPASPTGLRIVPSP
jgi:hypothetical protein